eukprot:138146-Hanusia_phi.AAC.3
MAKAPGLTKPMLQRLRYEEAESTLTCPQRRPTRRSRGAERRALKEQRGERSCRCECGGPGVKQRDEQGRGRGENLHVLLELARAHAHKRDPITVLGVHVGLS